MLTLVLMGIFTLVAVRSVIISIRELIAVQRLRRTGARVEGEVIDNAARSRSYYGGYLLYPVVRYRLDGKTYQGTLRNWQGKLELGSGVPLMVDPDDPYEPAAADRGTMTGSLPYSLITLAIGVALTIFAWHIRGE
jgi:uncharacterized protein DUF3592